jgi:hypothetical protein
LKSERYDFTGLLSVVGRLRLCGGFALLAASTSACVDVHGGALDLSWQLFGQNGHACTGDLGPCQAIGADSVRVQLYPISCDPAQAHLIRSFGCPQQQGTTRFDVPVGTYCIAVDATDANNAVVAQGPAPVLRDVENGEVVELGAFALTAAGTHSCPTGSL